MNMMLLTQDRLKISLNSQDLKEFSLQCGQIDIEDQQTRKSLIALLEQAKNEAGFRPRGAKLYVEMLPSAEDGCIIYITAMSKEKLAAKPQSPLEPVVFRFDDVEHLCNGAGLLYERYGHRIYKSLLYRLGREYRLILYSLDYSDQLSVYFLSEYAKDRGRGNVLAEFVKEHGSLLISQDAVDVLAEHFGRRD